MIVKEIDLVHIQDISIGIGQYPRFKGSFAFADRRLDVQRTDDAILSGADRKFNDLHRQKLNLGLLMIILFVALIAPSGRSPRIVVEPAAFNAAARRQEICQRPYRRRFCRSFLALNQYPAQPRVDDIQNQRFFHVLLPDNGGERKRILSFHKPILP